MPDATLSLSRLIRASLGSARIVLSWTAFFAGFAMTSIATAIVYHVQPFFVVLLSVAFLKERITLDQAIRMACAFVGVVLASGLVVSSSCAVTETWAHGIALTLGGAMLYAVATILAKGLGYPFHYRGLLINKWDIYTGLIFF